AESERDLVGEKRERVEELRSVEEPPVPPWPHMSQLTEDSLWQNQKTSIAIAGHGFSVVKRRSGAYRRQRQTCCQKNPPPVIDRKVRDVNNLCPHILASDATRNVFTKSQVAVTQNDVIGGGQRCAFELLQLVGSRVPGIEGCNFLSLDSQVLKYFSHLNPTVRRQMDQQGLPILVRQSQQT